MAILTGGAGIGVFYGNAGNDKLNGGKGLCLDLSRWGQFQDIDLSIRHGAS